MRIALCLLVLSLSLFAHANPKKYQGFCREVGSTKKTSALLGIGFENFPTSVTTIDENGKFTEAKFQEPTRMSPDIDQYVVLDHISMDQGTQFSMIYYGNVYASSPYFFEMTINFNLDANGGLKTHQLQTTYYKGNVSKGNEWNCEYQQY